MRPHRYDSWARIERLTLVNPDAPADLGATQEGWSLVARVGLHIRPERGAEAVAAGRLENTLLAQAVLERTAATAALDGSERLAVESGLHAQTIWAVLRVEPSLNGREMRLLIRRGGAV